MTESVAGQDMRIVMTNDDGIEEVGARLPPVAEERRRFAEVHIIVSGCTQSTDIQPSGSPRVPDRDISLCEDNWIVVTPMSVGDQNLDMSSPVGDRHPPWRR